jgi:hypothetical protein
MIHACVLLLRPSGCKQHTACRLLATRPCHPPPPVHLNLNTHTSHHHCHLQIAAVAAAEALLGHLSSQATPALATAQLKLLKDATSRLCLAEEQAEQAQQLLQQLEPKPEAPKPAPVEPKPAQEGEEGAEASTAEEEAAPAEEPVNVRRNLACLQSCFKECSLGL